MLIKECFIVLLENKFPSITTGLVKKTNYDTKTAESENKISSTTGSVRKTDYDANITKIDSKILNIADFVKRLI